MPIKVQETYSTTRLNQKRNSTHHIINIKRIEQRKNIKSCKRKGQATYKDRPVIITLEFSTEIQKPEGFGQVCYRL